MYRLSLYTICLPMECFERIWARLSYTHLTILPMKEHSRANQRDKILGISGSLAKNLLRWWCLRGLKDLPCIPSALPILFLGPTLRFQEMKIGR